MLLVPDKLERRTVIIFRVLLRRLYLALAIYVVGWTAPPEARSQQVACLPETGDLLHCVRGLVDGLRRESSSDPLTLIKRLREPLEALARKEGYDGLDGDLEELKRLSLELKASNKVANYEAISLLDNAISSNVREIRPALSWRALATKAEPGTNIQPAFVQQKLDFLKSPKAAFYDNGPFDLVRRTLLAGAIEDRYFLERSLGKDGRSDLLEEASVIEDLIGRLQNPSYDYLLRAQDRVKQNEINNQLFWKATINFLLGNKSEMHDALKKIAVVNREFGLEVNDTSRQVYSYRVFNEPYQILVGPLDENSQPKVTIKDDNLVRRFFNASQLALLICGSMDDVGSTNVEVEAYKKAVTGFDFYDYFVVVAADHNLDRVKRLEDALSRALDQARLVTERSSKANSIVNESRALLNTIQNGAEKCSVSREDRDRIYTPFVFKSQIKPIGNTWYLLLGGWLSANQATEIAQFLKAQVLPDARRSVPDLESNNDAAPYVARSLVVN
jgi:hypothetical protein